MAEMRIAKTPEAVQAHNGMKSFIFYYTNYTKDGVLRDEVLKNDGNFKYIRTKNKLRKVKKKGEGESED